jgi:hypothetical protein
LSAGEALGVMDALLSLVPKGLYTHIKKILQEKRKKKTEKN